MHRLICLLALTACATESLPVDLDPAEASSDGGKADGASALPDVRCTGAPSVTSRGFRHRHNKLTAALGDAKHRGIDLVATADEGTQRIEAEVGYGAFDDGIDDEDIELFACRAGAWKSLGVTRSKEHGAVALELEDSDRMPLGLRDMYLAVRGDASGARFLAYVAPAGSSLAVSDVDGTLTPFEAAFAGDALGLHVGIHDGAPAAFQTLASRGLQPVYVTARSRTSTAATREWLEEHGMPRGPVRLAHGVLLPGSATVEYKTDTLRAFEDFTLALGNGNRASDIEAYTAAGIAPEHITIKLPEFTLEVKGPLDDGKALGFDHYDDLVPMLDAN